MTKKTTKSSKSKKKTVATRTTHNPVTDTGKCTISIEVNKNRSPMPKR